MPCFISKGNTYHAHRYSVMVYSGVELDIPRYFQVISRKRVCLSTYD